MHYGDMVSGHWSMMVGAGLLWMGFLVLVAWVAREAIRPR